jgi:hypothetical protein
MLIYWFIPVFSSPKTGSLVTDISCEKGCCTAIHAAGQGENDEKKR